MVAQEAAEPEVAAPVTMTVDVQQPSTSYRDQPDLPDLPRWRLRHSLPGHSRAVTSVRLSPDGSLLASASADGTAAVWRTVSGEQVLRLEGHTAGLNDVAWSRDGRLLATASDDGTMQLWDAASGACLSVLKGHTHYVMACCFCPGGNMLASGSFDETVRVWDVHTGRCIKVFPAHSDPVTSVVWSNELEDPLVASCSFDGICRIWHATSGRCLKTLCAGDDPPPLSCVRFTPNSRFVLTTSMDPDQGSACVLWEVEKGQAKKDYRGHAISRLALQSCFVVCGGDKLVLSGSEDHHIYAWDLQKKHIAGLLRGRPSADAPGSGHCGVVFAVDATGAGSGVPSLIASGGMDSAVKIWEQVSD